MTTTVALITADVGDISAWALWGANASITRSTAQKRTGASSYLFASAAGGGMSGIHTLPVRADYYARVAVFITNFGNNTISFRETSTYHITLKIMSGSGRVAVYRGDENGTLLATGNLPILANTWTVIECYVLVDNSSGSVLLRIDGADDTGVQLTNIDTRNGGTAGVIDQFLISAGGGANMYIDDVKVCYGGWPGRHGIYVGVPTGPGSNAAWTPSAGDPYACVNEQPPDFTDYLSADGSVQGTKHDFAVTALPITPVSMGAVGVLAQAKLAVAGSGSLRTYGISNATPANGPDTGLDVSAKWVETYMDVDPDGGGAWTKTKADALKAGVETR